MKCADCHHEEENHDSAICSGDLTCLCTRFLPPILEAFAAEVEMQKDKLKTVYQRCLFILRKIPPARNAGEKTFAKIYREIWYGFKIRKEGTSINTAEWKRMVHDDTINRQKRAVKASYESLRTYEPEMLYHQTALWVAIVEQATEQ